MVLLQTGMIKSSFRMTLSVLNTILLSVTQWHSLTAMTQQILLQIYHKVAFPEKVMSKDAVVTDVGSIFRRDGTDRKLQLYLSMHGCIVASHSPRRNTF